MAEPQGDLELALLNGLDPSSHPALQDWSGGDSVVVRIPLPPVAPTVGPGPGPGISTRWTRRSPVR